MHGHTCHKHEEEGEELAFINGTCDGQTDVMM